MFTDSPRDERTTEWATECTTECATCEFDLARHAFSPDLEAGDVVTCPECGTRAVVHELIEGEEVGISFEPELQEAW